MPTCSRRRPWRYRSAGYLLKPGSDLQLGLRESLPDRCGAQLGKPLVGVAEPARRRCVRGVAIPGQDLHPLRLACRAALKQLKSLVPGESVGEVAEVDQVGDLGG